MSIAAPPTACLETYVQNLFEHRDRDIRDCFPWYIYIIYKKRRYRFSFLFPFFFCCWQKYWFIPSRWTVHNDFHSNKLIQVFFFIIYSLVWVIWIFLFFIKYVSTSHKLIIFNVYGNEMVKIIQKLVHDSIVICIVYIRIYMHVCLWL